MKTVKVIAKALFYITRLVAFLYFIVTAYALLIVLFSLLTSADNLPITVFDNKNFTIYYPFSEKAFLLGEYSSSYLVPTLLTIIFYGLFLWLLSGVFHAFKQDRLFTKNGLLQLSRFYMVNVIVPVVIMLLLLIFKQEVEDIVRITFLHLIIGVFAFFMAAIFKQGLVLQEEQDLIF
jgi:hypothetical protein